MDNEFPPSDPPSPPPAPPPLPAAMSAPLPAPPAALPAEARSRKGGGGWKVAAIILAILLIISSLGSLVQFGGDLIGEAAASAGGDLHLQETVLERHGSPDKIAVIPVEGIITSSHLDGQAMNMVQLIEQQLKKAGQDDHVKAVLLKVNSPGGEVLASDDIYNAIVKFQNDHPKPVIASMGTLAASGGYYVSAPCRWIVANELTITGSIGVIMHTYNYRGLMNKIGMRPMVYKSGRFKDMLSGEKDLDALSAMEKTDLAEEEAMVNRMIQETYGKFKSIVAEGRHRAQERNQTNRNSANGRALSPTWASLADGRILSGKEAYEHGFVDEIGNLRKAVERAASLAGIEKADLVTYQVPFSLANLFGFLGRSDAKSLKIDLGVELPRLRAGLYYLAPTFLH